MGTNKTYSKVGEVLKREMRNLGISQKDFAKAIAMSPSHLSEIINGKRLVTVKQAEKFQSIFLIPVSVWLDLQSNSQENGQVKDKSEESLMSLNEVICVKDLLLDFAQKNSDSPKDYLGKLNFDDKKNILAEYYGITSPNDLNAVSSSLTGFFRKSSKTGVDTRMITTWLLLARKEAQEKPLSGTFSYDSMTDVVLELRKVLHRNTNTLQNVEQILSKYGIRFVIRKKLEKASIDGYSYLENGVPTIIVTLRYTRIDNLAFNVLHEVYHVYKHLNSEQTSIISVSESRDDYQEEKEADVFAANALIPPSLWERAPEVPLNPFAIQSRYSAWAESMGLNKWIVLGRVSHETGMYKFKGDEYRNIN